MTIAATPSVLSLLSIVPVGLLPVVTFLLLLVYLDSYRMVRVRLVVAMIIAGGAVAGLCYVLNGELMTLLGMNPVHYSRWVAPVVEENCKAIAGGAVAGLCHVLNGELMRLLGMTLVHYSRWVAPVVEESCKALVVVWLFRTHRVGFLVDSAILGFAVGTGFAVVENFYYLYLTTNTTLVVWIVRGFGTALMHGGVVAIFAAVSQTMSESRLRFRLVDYVPGLLIAISVHSIFNHFFVSPVLSAVGTILILPPILYFVFRISERRTHRWLEVDFDEDSELMQMINSGNFSQSPAGIFLTGLQQRFDGTVVVDMFCYLRVYTELALRAKGLLLMRENGLDVKMDAETRDKFTELHYLEDSIGFTGCLLIRPFLQMSSKDLWQLHVLGK